MSHSMRSAVNMFSESTVSRLSACLMTSKRYRWATALVVLIVISGFLLLQNQDSLHQKLHQKLPQSTPEVQTTPEVDWSRFAYVQYVTNSAYLCNSVMFFESLHRLSSKADRVIMFPSKMLQSDDDNSEDARLLLGARDKYNVKLVPITIQHKDNTEGTWADSYTKLLAFNQTQYSRVLSIDSDTVLLDEMDDLFLLPSATIALPRAYWLYPDKEILAAHVMLIEPSETEFDRITAKINSASGDEYDMEIINSLYRQNALVLPHRGYALLTGEFRSDNHAKYLGSDTEVWDPAVAYSESKLIHFSDWPLPKPWLPISEEQRLEIQPGCTNRTDGIEDCTARTIWNSLYTDFKKKREEVCGQAS